MTTSRSRHVPGVRQNRYGRWEARYRDPLGRQRTQTFATKADAVAALDALRTAVRRGDWLDPAGPRTTFGEWADHWRATIVNLRPSTRARTESVYRVHIEPAFAELPLGAIDHLTVREWIAGLSASGSAPATVHKAHQVLAKIMRAAVDAGLLAASPCDRQPLPRIEREEMRFLEPPDVARLADAIDPRYRAWVLVAAYGGLRMGEAFALRRARVDLLRARVEVLETVVELAGHHHVGPPKTRAGRRSVPLPRFVVDELTEHLSGLEPDELVFPAPGGGYVRASLFRRRFWQPAAVAVGLGELVTDPATKREHYEGLRVHDLRHTAVALWIAAGASPTDVARRAGHASVVTVLDRYGHLIHDAEERVTDALDALARGAEAGRARPAKVVPMRARRAVSGGES